MLWPDPEKGPWWIKVWWRTQHGVPTPVGLSMKSWVDESETRYSGWHNNLPGPREDVALPALSGKMLRSLPLGRFLDETLARYDALLHLPSYAQDRTWYAETQPERDAIEAGKRSGTRDLGDDHYRLVARIYSEAVERRQPPTKAVAEALTIAKSSAAKQVARARERGFLPPTTRGRVGKTREEL
ncbi:MAG: hypothetical protein CVT65_13975 [Actinobacteria bacterium HGW-Actinobacteria-5]|nr:MAG: hypothetical protein CVT65_13975 [Actinobacteria bacterium HGW-Actinobacteria-5]